MYDVVAMKEELQNAIKTASDRVLTVFENTFQEIYQGRVVPPDFGPRAHLISMNQIQRLADLESIIAGPGFYVIFSTCNVDGNECVLRFGELQAIYRGECINVKQRIMSHLFHATYKSKHQADKKAFEERTGKSYYKEFWPHCLKLVKGRPGGIDIDQPPFCAEEWMVLVHRMKGSSQQVRQLAELAFDEVFGHPAGSRDI